MNEMSLEFVKGSYCQQSEQQGSAKQVLIFNVIIKNKVINYSFASETSLRIIRCSYFILITLYVIFPLGVSTSIISPCLCFKIALPKGDSIDIFFSSGLAC